MKSAENIKRRDVFCVNESGGGEEVGLGLNKEVILSRPLNVIKLNAKVIGDP